jgi:hypothetical protein
MHFVKNMSNNFGLESKKPYIEESFFPVVPKKYITISTENHQSKQWDHFQEYINLITPFLDKEGIKIIEVGANKIKLQSIISLKNITTPNQWSFIIKNALCHIGPENFISSLASFHDVPSISLFSNTSSDYASPDWAGDEYKTCVIEPLHKSKHASFTASENPKTINQISAEEVAEKTLSYLSIKNDFFEYDIFYIGSVYHISNVEVIPNFTPQPNFFPGSLLNIRLDYHFNTEALPYFAKNRKLSLISEKEIAFDKLNFIKQNIDTLFFKVDESFDIKYVEHLKRQGFKVDLVAKTDTDIHNTRLKFFDWNVSEEHKQDKKSIDNQEKICDTTRYKSSKMLFSNKGQFSSKICYDKNIQTHKNQMIIDEAEFWESSHLYKLYNLK